MAMVHAFIDGNKRIGMLVMLTFLELNGVKIDCTDEEIVEIALGIASGKTIYKAILDWVRKLSPKYVQPD